MKQPVFHGSSIGGAPFIAWLKWIYLVDFYGYFLEQWIGDVSLSQDASGGHVCHV